MSRQGYRIRMQIIKKDGTLREYESNKINDLLDFCFKNTQDLIEPFKADFDSMIFQRGDLKSTEIYDLLINLAVSKCQYDNNNFELLKYTHIASKLKLRKLYLEIGNQRKTNKSNPYDFNQFYSSFLELSNKGIYDPKLLEQYTRQEFKELYESINLDYDQQYDYAGFNILYKRYLMKDNNTAVELPQEMYLIIAMWLNTKIKSYNKLDMVIKLYHSIASLNISLATPILLNLRKPNANLASCFITGFDDSLTDIYSGLTQCANISKASGGIGVNMSRVRAEGSWIRDKKGASGGVMPWIKLINDTGIAVNQGGSRAGAITVALDIWHLDIYSFLDCQTENGDLRKKTYDIFPQVVICDEFMQRVEENANWTLFDPKEIRDKYNVELCELFSYEFSEFYCKLEQDESIELKKVIKAKDLFKKILQVVVETAMPYIFFKDSVNRLNPNSHDGMIGSANLCVSGDSLILTKDGYKKIQDISGQSLELWNGKEWSKSDIYKTSVDSEMLHFTFSNGSEIKCTNYHKFPILNNQRNNTFIMKPANEVNVGDRLFKINLPIIEGEKKLEKAYENGFFTGDGSYDCNNNPQISLYGKKIKLIDKFNYRLKTNYEVKTDKQRITLFNDLMPKYFVPNCQYDIRSRLDWLAGILDSDGCVLKSGESKSLQITSNDKDFLFNILLMLQETGIESKIADLYPAMSKMMPDGKGGKKLYDCKRTYRLLISSSNLEILNSLGLKTFRLDLNQTVSNKNSNRFIKILSIDKALNSDTYCFTEPKMNMGMFNGVILGNCVESFSNFSATKSVQKPIYDNASKQIVQNVEMGKSHVCSLISLNLSNKFEWDKHNEVEFIKYHSPLSVEILNAVIDLATCPSLEAQTHNEAYRIIGIGTIGLHDHLVQMKFPYHQSYKYAGGLMEQIMFYALEKSNKLSEDDKPYDRFEGSKFSEGIVCGKDVNWFKHHETVLGYEKWSNLIKSIKLNGLRNGSLLAVAPNTATSTLLGCSSSFLPVFSKFFIDENSKGSIPVAAKYLSDKTFALYKEMVYFDQKQIVEMTSHLQEWVDQGLSMELFINADNMKAKDLYDLYLLAWKQNLKTVYYVRQKTKSKEECISCAN